MKLKTIWIVIAVLMLVVTGLFIRSFRFHYQQRLSVGEIDKNVFRKLKYPFKINQFQAKDAFEKLSNEELFQNKWSLLYLGSQQTTDRTPFAFTKIDQIMQLMQKKSTDIEKVQAVFLTVTPKLDTSNDLKLISATHPLIQPLKSLRNDHIFIGSLVNSPVSVTDKGIFHPLNLYLVAPDKTMIGYFSYPFNPESVVVNFLKIIKCGKNLCK